MAESSLWQRFQRYFLRCDDLGFSIDISRMKLPEDFFAKMQGKIDKAFAAMRHDADPEDVFHTLHHLASNDPQVRFIKSEEPSEDRFSLKD